MKKVLGIVFHPVVLALLGLVALSAVIWWLGPMLALGQWRPLEPEWARWTLIALVVAVYVGKKLWRLFNAKMANAKMTEGLLQAPAAAPPEVSASDEETQTARKRFEEALGTLRRSQLGERRAKQTGLRALLFPRHYLYELPWYVFIGAPGAGKTTALVNSGLQFPLAESFGANAVRGIAGTRNYDWWFTNDAVLVDTAGRYTTQEANREVDAAGWRRFLELLKQHRPRRPINGIILTISIPDVLQQPAAELDKLASDLRKRIQELHEQLNIRFPIYVLITKCDLLAGFAEFFDDFGREERGQVWGVTFPYEEKTATAGSPLDRFEAEFRLLEQRLNDRLIERMQRERDLSKRALMYAFPQQFGAVKHVIAGFLANVFTASRFLETPMLRGVYFTSATQEGTPIDRVMGMLARSTGIERKVLPPQEGSGRSYFLTRLLKDLVFVEQGLAGTNLRWERRRTMLQLCGYAVIVLIPIGFLLAWFVSYRNNQFYLSEVQSRTRASKEQIESIRTGVTTNVIALLPALRSVKELSVASSTAQGVPLSMGFGLFQGDKLSSASADAYRRLLESIFLQRLIYRVEEQLRSAGRDDVELRYEALKIYLMFYDPNHFDSQSLKTWIRNDWEKRFAREVPTDQRQALEAHLDALFERGAVTPVLAADQQLIAQARAQLPALPHRIYHRLRQQGVGANVPEFTISQAAGPAAPLVFERASREPLTAGVPGLFTYDGYHRAFVSEAEKVAAQLVAEESWVLGLTERQRVVPAEVGAFARVAGDVRRLYLEEYARVWAKFVSDIRLVRPDSLQRATELAGLLSAPDSPLPLLFRAIVRQTTLAEMPEAEKSLLEKGKEKAQESLSAIGKILPGAEAPAISPAGPKLEKSIVDDRFDGLRRFVRSAAPGQPAPIDATTGLLNELHAYLVAVDQALKSNVTPPQNTVGTKIKADAARVPEPIRGMLQTLASSAAVLAARGERANVSSEMRASIGDFCSKAISGRYPFVRSSANDVTQEDFARLFSPGGMLDDFFQKKLAQHVDTSKKQWTFKRVDDVPLSDSSVLVQFQRAAVIRDVFFRGGPAKPSLRLEFKPLEMDARITQFTLDVDGQIVKYAHGPQVPQTVQWPGPKGSTQVRVQIQPPASSGGSGTVSEGPWALFRLFDLMQMESTGQAEKFHVSFNIEGRTALFEVTASSVQNPFRLKELEQFQCPAGL